jgi:uncharacterized protein involved in exopolysaccharide biosynthesis
MSSAALSGDTIDLADIARNIRRGWRFVLGGVVFGAAVAAAVVFFVPARFAGAASIVVHNPEGGSKGLISRLAGSLPTGAGAAADLLPAGLGSNPPIETEVQILSSRSMVGEAVDSLLLQLRIKSSDRDAPWRLFQSAALPGAFKKKGLHFTKLAGGDAYEVTGLGATPDTARNGVLQHGAFALRFDPKQLPSEFGVDVYDREEAVTRIQKRVDVGKLGGEVLSVSFRGDDSLTAAAVPNLLIRRYLVRRKTTDRGINQQRVEFLTVQVDSVEQNLSAAERALRQQQESSGIVDPIVVGKLELEQAGEIRKEAGTLDIERGAIGQLLSQLAAGTLTGRQLAAFPTFLRSPGINELLGQLSTLETKRLQLLATATPEDPNVIAATEGIKNIENQLPPMARTYASTLDRQRADITKQLDTLRNTIAMLPAVGQVSMRLQREVLRLSQVNAALRAQLVEAKLSAIGEGGDIRLLDRAEPPRRVSFPRPVPTLAAGVGGGLLIGALCAALAGLFGRYVSDARSIERQLGVPALTFDASLPLVIASPNNARTLLLVPIDASADTAGVAERLVRTATTRSLRATVVDFSRAKSGEALPAPDIDRLATEFDTVVVRLPELSNEITVGALRDTRPVLFVATAGRVDRERLTNAVESLQRLSVPCAGVVLSRHLTGNLISS